MSIYGVEEYLKRAKAFIHAADESSLRHACLELRFCIETIVYKRLGQVGPALPRHIYRTWQPPKAMKLLLSFEPGSDQDAVISLYPETIDGEPSGQRIVIGEYRMFPAKTLNKLYNKLGKFLHVTAPSEEDNPPEISIGTVLPVLEEVERVASATVVISVNSIQTLPCSLCGADMYASEHQIKDQAEIVCYQDNCQAKHVITLYDDQSFDVDRRGQRSVPCLECGQRMALETIEHDEVKTCIKCGQLHSFRWSVAKLPIPTA
ncbi:MULTISPECIES: hypothetical protein [Pseudomonas]|uniref:hypothetical protein n=1 Tax=Pseudomonas TaxID=286 RepID=UPI000AC8B158|nr:MULTISPECIES: hypothetical protein [Pseudomonas]PZR32709.1 MAG: hypothetical protein DI538_19125 [Azospira oryzae]MBA6123273.1 hypothetical protein [Pseudomonas juntendi]MCF3158320.1 hypothetical protein [Pseudomonas juntendi]MCQ1992450.1 hypothetical protein [Pseudomonas sp. Eb3]MDG9892032.1 hypothetical protein [Pseudomonas juntendi]